MKVSTKYPRTNEVFGVWVGDQNGDAHIDFEHGCIVLGRNGKAASMKFTPQALIFAEGGKVSYQYADEKGEPVTKDIKPETAQKLIHDLLNSLDGLVKSGQA